MNNYVIPVLYAPMTQKLLAFIEANPGATPRAMATHFEVHIRCIDKPLALLHKNGLVRPRRGSGVYRRLWELGQDENIPPAMRKEADGQPRRKTVSEWEPHMQRDPLVAALFG